jgi:prepilin-type N-terminal cleavage/methylation domain-containing protein
MRADEGMTLIELLIAMTILAIGIAALVAGFSSGILSVNRARLASTAGALADKQMETYRQGSYASVPTTTLTTTPPGPDGRTYWMQVVGQPDCAVGTYQVGPPATCSGTSASTPARLLVKVVTITVRDGGPPPAKLLFTESATFDSSTG